MPWRLVGKDKDKKENKNIWAERDMKFVRTNTYS